MVSREARLRHLLRDEPRLPRRELAPVASIARWGGESDLGEAQEDAAKEGARVFLRFQSGIGAELPKAQEGGLLL